MKASELVKKLNELITEHGDKYMRYDAYGEGLYKVNHVLDDGEDFIISCD